MDIHIIKASDDLIIESNEFVSLPQSCISQFMYYGFVERKLNLKISWITKYDLSVLKKLINYLNGINFLYDLSDEIEEIISLETQKIEEFNLKKEKAKNYKDSMIDEEDFSQFKKFLDEKIFRVLKEHQVKAAYHNYILNSAANFSVPGSGKTTTILSVYEKLKYEDKVDCLFVVGPPSSFISWKNEFYETLNRKSNEIILSGKNQEERATFYFNPFYDSELYLISYQSFSSDYELINQWFNNKLGRVFFVIDEAHYVKQLNGKWASSILHVSDSTEYKSVLTGTPCPKSYVDLFNLFDILYRKYQVFTEDDKTRISFFEKSGDYKGAAEIIQNCIDPLFYRVRKSELGLQNAIFNDPIIIRMNSIERFLYDSIFEKISEKAKAESTDNIMPLIKLRKARIIRLRQLLSNASLLSSAFNDENNNEYNDMFDKQTLKDMILNYEENEEPAKLLYLYELIKEIQKRDKKILVWSNFIGSIQLIERKLKSNGIKCDHIYGQTPFISDNTEEQAQEMTREQKIKQFLSVNGDIDVLIANPAACAESISLHKGCYHAVYYDLSYNCAQFLQSLDRIHRVGGSEVRTANYYFLQYENTIDKSIYENILKKRDKMYEVIEKDYDIYNLNYDSYLVNSEDDDELLYNEVFIGRGD